jgi:HD-like signal output (HDOD) protein/CheY-like chemotaxis protein
MSNTATQNTSTEKPLKQSIYVVDDEALLMEALVMTLRCMGKDWEVTGFTDPAAALEAIKANPPGAVLTDQRMPGMQGSELLEKVRLLSPTSLRLIMSGYVSLKNLTLITSAHQYIAKPFDLEKLRDLIQRSFAAQQRIINHGLQNVVTSIRAIPSLPQAHHSLLKELEDNEGGNEIVANLIGRDPGLSVKVLQLANSGLFGTGHMVADLLEAVNTLGTEIITSIVLSQSVFQHYETLKHPEVDLQKVWTHCWETGVIAQHLCRHMKLSRVQGEAAFLAGLLHEIGRFVLIENFPKEFQAACDLARNTKRTLSDCLCQEMQATPSEISGYVLELWSLPSPVINSIYLQEHPEKSHEQGFTITTALHVANHLASKKYPPDSFLCDDWNLAYIESIGCKDDIPAWETLDTTEPSED